MPLTTYIEKQKKHYFYSLNMGHTDFALDALWRAASHVGILLQKETSYHALTPERISELLFMLDWQRD